MQDKLFAFFIKKKGKGPVTCVKVTLMMGMRERAIIENNIR